MPQTDREIDTIRERSDARAIDAGYDHQESRRDAKQRMDDEIYADGCRAIVRAAERIDAAIVEVSDVQDCLRKGMLDYTALAGILVEYLPEILRGLLALQSPSIKDQI